MSTPQLDMATFSRSIVPGRSRAGQRCKRDTARQCRRLHLPPGATERAHPEEPLIGRTPETQKPITMDGLLRDVWWPGAEPARRFCELMHRHHHFLIATRTECSVSAQADPSACARSAPARGCATSKAVHRTALSEPLGGSHPPQATPNENGAHWGRRLRLVAWGGIEPPTRGFSIRCSTN